MDKIKQAEAYEHAQRRNHQRRWIRSSYVQANSAKIRQVERTFGVLATESSTAEAYGRLKASLRLKGRPIPEHDIWIAATALEFGLPLVTRDQPFDYVEGLNIEQWQVNYS